MPIVIHWDWEGHSASKPLQSSCTETLLAPRAVLRAAARAIQIFAVFIFEYGASIRNMRKFAPFEKEKDVCVSLTMNLLMVANTCTTIEHVLSLVRTLISPIKAGISARLLAFH